MPLGPKPFPLVSQCHHWFVPVVVDRVCGKKNTASSQTIVDYWVSFYVCSALKRMYGERTSDNIIFSFLLLLVLSLYHKHHPQELLSNEEESGRFLSVCGSQPP